MLSRPIAAPIRCARTGAIYVRQRIKHSGTIPTRQCAFSSRLSRYKLRLFFASRADTKAKLPDFIRRCSDLAQFWGFIKYERARYAERRTLIWDAFRPLIEYLETHDRSPGVAPISATLEAFDPDHVRAAWQKALDRRAADPEGAITAARSLLETVCKYVLDDA